MHGNMMTSYLGIQKPLHILVVEDNKPYPKTVAFQLQELGYHALSAMGIEKALTWAPTQPIDLIIVEQISYLNRIVLHHQLIQQHPRPYIIALISPDLFLNRDHCISMGMDDYLHKPVSAKQLRMVLCYRFYQLQAVSVIPHESLQVPELLARTGYDTEVLKELITLFIEDGERLLQELQQTFHAQEITQFKLTLHALKGICSTLCAKQMRLTAIQLENSIKHEQKDTIDHQLQLLNTEFNALQALLPELSNAFNP